MGVVYLARCKVNGKPYVGKTSKGMKIRKYEHLGEAKRGRRLVGCPFHRALRKYGSDTFEWKVLMEEDNEDDLNESERACIRLLKSKVPNGYNMTEGGDGTAGIQQSVEANAKRRKALIGKVRTEETKQRISETLTGRTFTKEHKRKISEVMTGRVAWNRGIPCTEEQKQKISKGNAGKIAWNIGIPCTEEHKRKVSKGNTGRVRTPEVRVKMKASQRKRRAREKAEREIK